MPLRLFKPDYGELADKDVYRRHLLAGERAAAEGIATLETAPAASPNDLQLAHTDDYIQALLTGVPPELACSGGMWSPEFLDIHLSALGAFWGAIDAAQTGGVAGMLGGGGHHAFPGRGGALSPINDVAIGVHHLRREGARRVLILDLDAHFGNGTTACLPNDPEVFLFDFHGHASGLWRPDTPHLFRDFHLEPDARLYLRTLRQELPRVLNEFQPEFCLYGAGMDVFSGTPNPPLRLKVPEIEQRDGFVFETLTKFQVPVVYHHAGGYASLETVVGLHQITARAAFRAMST